jgi:hypothetical protein
MRSTGTIKTVKVRHKCGNPAGQVFSALERHGPG